MNVLRSMRFLLLALLLAVIPASSYAGVFISVAIAPPVLPVYEQPPCPEPGWMWTPGYWAYGDNGYYWVPGTWVPAPYTGALWTPGYWGWSTGMYVFHPGYWGAHVGYYGGVNYGFGYMGIGFVGGAWHGHEFAYNTAVMHVNRTVIHNVYEDRTIVRNTTIINDRHVAYSGGPGGIDHRPTAQETSYMHEQHRGPSSFQTQHQTMAMHDTNSWAKHNGGHPTNPAMARPMGVNANAHANFGSQPNGGGNQPHGNFNNSQPRGNNGSPEFHNNVRPAQQQPYHSPSGNNANPQVHNNVRPAQQQPNNPPHNSQPQSQPHQQPQQPQSHGGDQHGGGHDHDHGH